MNRSKKILTLLLCLAMVLVTSPATVFAGVEGYGATAKNADTVCMIGDQEYESLELAFSEAEDGATIVLTGNTAVDTVISVNTNVKLDLNGHVVTNNVKNDKLFDVNAQSFSIEGSTAGSGMIIAAGNEESHGFIDVKAENANLTLTGGRYEGKTVAPENESDYASFITLRESGAQLALNDVSAVSDHDIVETETVDTINVQVNRGEYIVDVRGFHFDVLDCIDSPITFDGVSITTKRGPCIELSGGSGFFKDCDFEVTGEIEPQNAWSASAIGTGYGATVNIISGTYKATNYGVYTYSSGSNTVIDGGTFEAKVALRADVSDDYYNNYGYETHMIINDGNFSGDIQTSRSGDGVKDYEEILIRGGNFTSMTVDSLKGYNIEIRAGKFPLDVSQYVPEGNKLT